MLESVEWGEFRLEELFEINIAKSFDEGKLNLIQNYKDNYIEFIGRTKSNNGIKGYTKKLNLEPNIKNVISISQIGTIVAQIRNFEWYASQNIFILKPNNNKLINNFLSCSINFVLDGSFSAGYSNYPTLEKLKNLKIQLPIKNKQIDFEFMESFIAELEAQRIAELEAYLSVSGLKDYNLTKEEKKVLEDFESLDWESFNLKKLFGSSTRGKRLKSDDRISGNLPFVTAGEKDEGISDFISNNVEIFSSNTTTIDMFGSAKYRSYEYGGDDHIAVVHTEKLSKFSAIFTTTAIHKSSYTDKFSYSRNFYAKDADELDIKLPSKNSQPDYSIMETFISAVQKLVIKDVVLYSEKKLNATRGVVGYECKEVK